MENTAKAIRVTITDMDGQFLDYFPVCYHDSEDAGSFSEEENVGNRVSDTKLIERIRSWVPE